jgi:hypothetical protein
MITKKQAEQILATKHFEELLESPMEQLEALETIITLWARLEMALWRHADLKNPTSEKRIGSIQMNEDRVPDPAGWNRIQELENRLRKIHRLFAGGPDTPCRTTWRPEDTLTETIRVECVEVPMEDLREALDG